MVQLALGYWLPGHCCLHPRLMCAHPKDCSISSGASGEAGRDFWQGRVSTWSVWQKNEKTGRPPGSLFIQVLAEVLQMLSGSVDADAISPSVSSNISSQPQSLEAYSLFVAQECQGVKVQEPWLLYPHL